MYIVSKKVKLKIQLQMRQRSSLNFSLIRKFNKRTHLFCNSTQVVLGLLNACYYTSDYFSKYFDLYLLKNASVCILFSLHVASSSIFIYYRGTLLSLYYLYFIISTTSSASSLVAFSLNSNLDRALKKRSNANIISKSPVFNWIRNGMVRITFILKIVHQKGHSLLSWADTQY